jgi:shikimate kinase
MPSTGTRPRLKLVCLAGFMGSGKSTVGRLLAQQLGWRFVDLDERIEQQSGLRITDIFDRLGEARFRELERTELSRALGEASASPVPVVLALGGGTFTQPANLDLLRAACAPEGLPRAGCVVWLDCPVEQLLARCVVMDDRPLFRDEISFRKLYEERLPFYRMADVHVEGSGEPRIVAERILTALDGEGTSRAIGFDGGLHPQVKWNA